MSLTRRAHTQAGCALSPSVCRSFALSEIAFAVWVVIAFCYPLTQLVVVFMDGPLYLTNLLVAALLIGFLHTGKKLGRA